MTPSFQPNVGIRVVITPNRFHNLLAAMEGRDHVYFTL